MELIRWLYEAHGHVFESGPLRCYLSGWSCPPSAPLRDKVLRGTFTNHDLARCKESNVVHPALTWYLDDQSHRRKSYAMQKGNFHTVRDWDRAHMKSDLLRFLESAPPADSVYIIALSKKKHLALRAPVTPTGSRALYVQFEERLVTLEKETFKGALAAFGALLEIGLGKGEILSFGPSAMTLQKVVKAGKFAAMQGHLQQLQAHRDTPFLQLISYVHVVEKPDAKTKGGKSGE